jgi:4-amino-4-deoxy-L-arabinose transferase-like glycosyltransferase
LNARILRAAALVLVLCYVSAFVSIVSALRSQHPMLLLYDDAMQDRGDRLLQHALTTGTWLELAGGLGIQRGTSATLSIPIDKPQADTIVLAARFNASKAFRRSIECSSNGTQFVTVADDQRPVDDFVSLQDCSRDQTRIWIRIRATEPDAADNPASTVVLDSMRIYSAPQIAEAVGALDSAGALRFDFGFLAGLAAFITLGALCVLGVRTPVLSAASLLAASVGLLGVMRPHSMWRFFNLDWTWLWLASAGFLAILWTRYRKGSTSSERRILGDLSVLWLVGLAGATRWHVLLNRVYRGLDPDVITVAAIARQMRHLYDTSFREPLWVWMARASLGIVHDPEWAMRLYSFVLSLLIVVIGYRLVRDYLQDLGTALLTSLLLASHEYLIASSARGLRTELYMFALAAVVYFLFVPSSRLKSSRRIAGLSLSVAAATMTQLGTLITAIPLLVLARYRHRLSWRAVVLPLVVTAAAIAPYLRYSQMKFHDPLWSQNVHASFYRNYEYLAVTNVGCDGCPSRQEYATNSYAGRPVTMNEYIFGMHPLSVVTGRVLSGYGQLYVEPGGLLATYLGSRSPVIYLLYLVGLVWLVLHPARELLLVPLLSINLLAFVIPLGIDPRLAIHTTPIAAIAVACGAVGLLRLGRRWWRRTATLPNPGVGQEPGCDASAPVSRGRALSSSIDVVLLFATAFAVRIWHVEQLGFSHWDEAFYVSEGRALAANWSDAIHHLGFFAAPGMGLALGGVFKTFGTSDWVAFLVPVLAGSLAVSACYLLGRDLYGRSVAFTAAACLALSEAAVMYSRLVIADSLFLAVLLLGVWLLWKASNSRHWWPYAWLGMWSGLLFFIKFDGFYLVLLALAWLGWRTLPLLPNAARAGVRHRLFRTLSCCLALLICAGAGIAITTRMVTPEYGGLHAVVAQFMKYSVGSGVRIVTSPELIVGYFLAWISLPALAFSIVGLSVAVRQRTTADCFLGLLGASYFAAVLFYTSYPRLALPLFPVIFLFASRGLVWTSDLLGRLPIGSTVQRRRLIAVVLASLLLIAEAGRLPRVLRLETLGYANAAKRVSELKRNAAVYEHTQPDLTLYTKAATPIDCSPEVISSLETPGPKAILIDQTASWGTAFSDFLRVNSDRLATEGKIPNPLYDEVILQPATLEGLRTRLDPPDRYRNIVILASNGPLDPRPLCRG